MRKLQMFICRHAQRVENEDRITDHGKQQASALGRTLRRDYPKRTILGMSSTSLRACETLAAILAGAGLGNVPSLLQDAVLENEVPPGGILTDISSPNAAFNAYVHFGNTRPTGHAFAPREVAARLVRLLYRHLDATPSPPLWVAVTHSGMLEVLLASLLKIQQIETIGGVFEYLEGATLLFEENQTLSLSMQVFLRGHTYGVADDVLRSFLQEKTE